MQRLDKALLVVSFGTTHEETRKKTIDAIEEHLAAAFPDRRLYRGWTSRMIVKRLRDRDGAEDAAGLAESAAKSADGPAANSAVGPAANQVHTDTLEEALERMQAEGIRDVLVQPTHMIPGAENDRMLSALSEAVGRFDCIRAGQPLLSTEEDREQLAKILAEQLLGAELSGERTEEPGAGEASGAGGAPGARALVLMGHGSAKRPEANRIYDQMQQAFRNVGCENVYVGTVEGTPTLEDVLEQMQAHAGEVILAPLMIVAGDHAKNDMAGPEEDSWQSRLEAAGHPVVSVLRGLGEYPAVQEMLVRHARAAERIK